MQPLLDTISQALTLNPASLRWQGVGSLPSTYAVSELAAASIGAAGLALARLLEQQTDNCPLVRVDRRLASFWFASSLRPQGWQPPGLWDAIAGDYACADGWIRLHTNAPHHRAAVERVLGSCANRNEVASKVASWSADQLESALVAAGGCAARMRSWLDWCAHPQGQAVNAQPLILRETFASDTPLKWRGTTQRPLAGIKVLDLTRILAGPIATRLLAGFGAQVLRIDPPAGKSRQWLPKSPWASAAHAWICAIEPIAWCSSGCWAMPTSSFTAIAQMHSSDWALAMNDGASSTPG